MPRRKPSTETLAQLWAKQAERHQQQYQKQWDNLSPQERKHRAAHMRFSLNRGASTTADFPLNQVADIAARFLQGTVNPSQDDYRSAAKRAMTLLEYCKKAIEENKEQRETSWLYYQQAADPRSDFEVPKGIRRLPFLHAIKTITRQTRPDRAEENYLTLLQKLYPHAKKPRLTKFLKAQERKGIDSFSVRRLRTEYFWWFERPKKFGKKVLAESADRKLDKRGIGVAKARKSAAKTPKHSAKGRETAAK